MDNTVHHNELNTTWPKDCGNAPRKEVLKDFNVAFATGDIDFILEHTSDNIIWHMVGDKTIEGKDNLKEALDQMTGSKATELHIHNIITHGNTASANGIITFGQKSYAFCDVYVFGGFTKNAKIKEMTSYVIDVS